MRFVGDLQRERSREEVATSLCHTNKFLGRQTRGKRLFEWFFSQVSWTVDENGFAKEFTKTKDGRSQKIVEWIFILKLKVWASTYLTFTNLNLSDCSIFEMKNIAWLLQNKFSGLFWYFFCFRSVEDRTTKRCDLKEWKEALGSKMIFQVFFFQMIFQVISILPVSTQASVPYVFCKQKSVARKQKDRQTDKETNKKTDRQMNKLARRHKKRKRFTSRVKNLTIERQIFKK